MLEVAAAAGRGAFAAGPTLAFHRRMPGKIIPLHTYNDGKPYRPARGRHAPRAELEDRLADTHAVVDLRRERLSTEAWLARIVREMKIRFYQTKTIKSYHLALSGLLRWFARPPHELTREDLRRYLELLVDGSASSSWVGVNLSAARAAFDKMCGESITRGLTTPRRPNRLPAVLAPAEVVRLLEAAPTLRDKLLLSFMYATGLRVSEVVRLRWRDLDRARGSINVWQGKGRKDRQVMLPESLLGLLHTMPAALAPKDYIFASTNPGRHISARTVQTAMTRAVRLAGIDKPVTTHSLRHSFATSLLESGVDVRFIQKLLGHARLETTRLYTHVATSAVQKVKSPLDQLPGAKAPRPSSNGNPVAGRLRIELERDLDGATARAALWIVSTDPAIKLDGIVLKHARPGWITMDLPPLESWAEQLSWLPQAARERFEDPAFYEELQRLLARKLLELPTADCRQTT